jgi:hypothetical protein
MADMEVVPEPLNLKEDRSANHARDRAHKPGDRAKKFSAKSQPKGALVSDRSHKKARQGLFMRPTEVERTANPGKGHFAVKEGVVAAGVRDETDGDIGPPSSGEDTEGDPSSQPVDAEGTPRMVARDVPLEDLLAAAVKKPKKPRGERNHLGTTNSILKPNLGLAREYDYIRGLRAGRSAGGSKKSWIPVQALDDGDWESIAEHTETWQEEYSEEWRAEMAELIRETSSDPYKPSYATVAGGSSSNSSATGTPITSP